MSVYDGKPPCRNPEPWPEGRIPTNNLERLIASARRPPEKPVPAPQPALRIATWQERVKADPHVSSFNACLAEIADLRAELARRGRAQGGNTSNESNSEAATPANTAPEKPCKQQMIAAGAKAWPRTCPRCGKGSCTANTAPAVQPEKDGQKGKLHE